MNELKKRREEALLGGGTSKIDAQHAKGKMTARERLDALLDEGSFEEFGMLETESVVTGRGTIEGRIVYVYAYDFTRGGGSLGIGTASKITKVQDMAGRCGAPIIGICDSGGARIQEGIDALAGYGEIFERNILSSGVIPQISLIMGPCAGGAVYSPALTDFTIMVRKTSYMFITGPSVVKTVTGEDVSQEELGGADIHSAKSGVAHFAADDEKEAMDTVRRLLSYLPSNNMETPPEGPSPDDEERFCKTLETIIPASSGRAYDMYGVISEITDNGDFLEVHKDFARNIIVGFARLGGRSVGIVANQPSVMAGVLDIAASRKAARFVRFCDAFNIPIVTLVDVPGFLCGTRQEYGAIITSGAKLIYAYGEATVPKVTVTLRKSYGGAHIVMGCKQLRSDVNYAWPSAEIAVMGAEGAAGILHGKDLKAETDPEKASEMLDTYIKEYNEEFCNPYKAAERGYIEDVIEPGETRFRIIRALRSLETKREELPSKKHDNLPL